MKKEPHTSTNYKIIVPTQEDKDELIKASKHIHDSFDTDKEFIVINQISHEYIHGTNIIVDKTLYDKL